MTQIRVSYVVNTSTMARSKKHTTWHPNKYEKTLLAITAAVALICGAIMASPIIASLTIERLPDDVPLLRTFPLQP